MCLFAYCACAVFVLGRGRVFVFAYIGVCLCLLNARVFLFAYIGLALVFTYCGVKGYLSVFVFAYCKGWAVCLCLLVEGVCLLLLRLCPFVLVSVSLGACLFVFASICVNSACLCLFSHNAHVCLSAFVFVNLCSLLDGISSSGMHIPPAILPDPARESTKSSPPPCGIPDPGK